MRFVWLWGIPTCEMWFDFYHVLMLAFLISWFIKFKNIEYISVFELCVHKKSLSGSNIKFSLSALSFEHTPHSTSIY